MEKGIKFTNFLGRMVVEESLSGSSTRAPLSHRYNISPQFIIHWGKDYTAGKLHRDNDPDRPVESARFRELERSVGKPALGNELLKAEGGPGCLLPQACRLGHRPQSMFRTHPGGFEFNSESPQAV